MPSNSCRSEGCTLTGALSVTTSISDCVSIIHGPAGCAHHNFSLLHTIAVDHGDVDFPLLASSGMLETEIVFGGEDALRKAIRSAVLQDASLVCVLSTCIAETIGDDIRGVCNEGWHVPVIPVPAAGFLGGSFQDGMNNALEALAGIAPPGRDGDAHCRVNLIGEKNLEYDVEENYAEVARLLGLVGLDVNVRFVRRIRVRDLARLGSASLNIFRDEKMASVEMALHRRTGIPSLASFPFGLSGTRLFLEHVRSVCGFHDTGSAVEREQDNQRALIKEFSDIAGSSIAPDPFSGGSMLHPALHEVIGLLDLEVHSGGKRVPFPSSPPVGTNGMKRTLHRWRRAIHA